MASSPARLLVLLLLASLTFAACGEGSNTPALDVVDDSNNPNNPDDPNNPNNPDDPDDSEIDYIEGNEAATLMVEVGQGIRTPVGAGYQSDFQVDLTAGEVLVLRNTGDVGVRLDWVTPEPAGQVWPAAFGLQQRFELFAPVTGRYTLSLRGHFKLHLESVRAVTPEPLAALPAVIDDAAGELRVVQVSLAERTILLFKGGELSLWKPEEGLLFSPELGFCQEGSPNPTCEQLSLEAGEHLLVLQGEVEGSARPLGMSYSVELSAADAYAPPVALDGGALREGKLRAGQTHSIYLADDPLFTGRIEVRGPAEARLRIALNDEEATAQEGLTAMEFRNQAWYLKALKISSDAGVAADYTIQIIPEPWSTEGALDEAAPPAAEVPQGSYAWYELPDDTAGVLVQVDEDITTLFEGWSDDPEAFLYRSWVSAPDAFISTYPPGMGPRRLGFRHNTFEATSFQAGELILLPDGLRTTRTSPDPNVVSPGTLLEEVIPLPANKRTVVVATVSPDGSLNTSNDPTPTGPTSPVHVYTSGIPLESAWADRSTAWVFEPGSSASEVTFTSRMVCTELEGCNFAYYSIDIFYLDL